jgi:hypothetical protein
MYFGTLVTQKRGDQEHDTWTRDLNAVSQQTEHKWRARGALWRLCMRLVG